MKDTKNRQATIDICKHLGYSPPEFSTYGSGHVYKHLGASDASLHPVPAKGLQDIEQVLYMLIDHLGLEICHEGLTIKKKSRP